MKRKLFLILAVLIVSALCFGGCTYADYFMASVGNEVVASLGVYKDKEYYTCGGFQDSTDYAKYKYDDVNLEENKFLEPLTVESRVEFIAYLNNFESSVEGHKESDPENEIVKGYDFSTDLITDDDYIYIDDRSTSDDFYEKFENYNVYFFDTGTSTLFFFHNNI